MRFALLSDIHGNSIALDAVLADIASRGGIDAYWVLGDLVALGPDPVGVMERLVALPNASFIRGNTDRYVACGDRPGPTIEEAAASPRLLPSLVEVASTFAWTQGMITAGGWLDWLRDLPLERRLTLPDGTQVLLVHASPGYDDGDGIAVAGDTPEIAEALGSCGAALVCVGHTHQPFDRGVRGIRVVNPGAISLSVGLDKSASYAVLDADDTDYRLAIRRVPYDRPAVVDQLNRIGHPARGFLIRHL